MHIELYNRQSDYNLRAPFYYGWNSFRRERYRCLVVIEPICRTRLHCPTCRDLEGGRAWRESLGKAFKLPEDAPDFECPHGIEWGVEWVEPIGVESKPPTAEQLMIMRRKKICEACESKPTCGFFQGTPCRANNILKKADSCCPINKWIPIKE